MNNEISEGPGIQHKEIPVYTAFGQLSGEMIRIFLESKGIPARLSQESAGVVHGLTVGPLGEVAILVSEERADEAIDLLERMEAGEFELPAVEDERSIQEDSSVEAEESVTDDETYAEDET